MRVAFNLHKGQDGGSVQLFREPGDPKFYGTAGAKGESALLRFLMKWLNERGFRLIKRGTQQDGHMMGDEWQRYLRPPKAKTDAPHIYIYSGFYALRGANDDWNKEGSVELMLVGNTVLAQSNWQDRIVQLGKQHGFDVIVYGRDGRAE